MNRNTESPQKPEQRDEAQDIDLVELLRRLWCSRRLILKITGICFVIGLLLAIFGSKEYTAGCQFVPQTKSNMASSGMASLAALAGVNISSLMGSDQLISPMVYPNVMNSTAYRRDLLRTEIHLEGEKEPVTLLTYLSDKKYRKLSVGGAILKYTIGLPGVIIRAIKGDPDERDSTLAGNGGDYPFIVLTKEERKAIRALKKIVTMKVEEKKGYVVMLAHMPEARAAAEVAESAVQLLQQYITDFKLQKVQGNLDFIQARYEETRQEYERIQEYRAAYMDANQGLSTNRATTTVEKLDNEYNLAFDLYQSMASQLEQARIHVKETTPVFTFIDPVTMPVRPSKPRRMMTLVGFTFFGLVLGCGYVFARPALQQIFGEEKREE